MTKNQVLFLAQQIAARYGDENWWREHYVKLREYHGVVESALGALDAQDLRGQFELVAEKLQKQQAGNQSLV